MSKHDSLAHIISSRQSAQTKTDSHRAKSSCGKQRHELVGKSSCASLFQALYAMSALQTTPTCLSRPSERWSLNTTPTRDFSMGMRTYRAAVFMRHSSRSYSCVEQARFADDSFGAKMMACLRTFPGVSESSALHTSPINAPTYFSRFSVIYLSWFHLLVLSQRMQESERSWPAECLRGQHLLPGL